MPNRTKIVATIGPASSGRETLSGLLRAGMDVARLNLSHGTREEHAAVVERLRELEAETGRPVAILADLAGPKIRVGSLPGGRRSLADGDEPVLSGVTAKAGGDRIPVSLATIHREVAEGDRVLLDDGRIRLRVAAVDGDAVRCRVESGGVLEDGKGVNLPDTDLSLPSLTEKDLADLDFLAGEDVDLLALSFVRSPADVRALRRELARREIAPLVVAKIETARAVARIDGILEEADAVMVARGDLGVETGPERVPVIQKVLIAKALEKGRPVITATEMLESMRTSSRPTRAEASDVANAVFDGSDAVMLSGETSVGEHPIRVVETMERILEEAERHLMEERSGSRPGPGPRMRVPEDAIAAAAVEAARTAGAKAIAAFTRSGATAGRIAGFRPRAPVLALSSDAGVRRRLLIRFGVEPLAIEPVRSLDEALARTDEALLATGRFREGDPVVIVAGLSERESETGLLALRRLGRANEKREGGSR